MANTLVVRLGTVLERLRQVPKMAAELVEYPYQIKVRGKIRTSSLDVPLTETYGPFHAYIIRNITSREGTFDHRDLDEWSPLDAFLVAHESDRNPAANAYFAWFTGTYPWDDPNTAEAMAGAEGHANTRSYVRSWKTAPRGYDVDTESDFNDALAKEPDVVEVVRDVITRGDYLIIRHPE